MHLPNAKQPPSGTRFADGEQDRSNFHFGRGDSARSRYRCEDTIRRLSLRLHVVGALAGSFHQIWTDGYRRLCSYLENTVPCRNPLSVLHQTLDGMSSKPLETSDYRPIWWGAQRSSQRRKVGGRATAVYVAFLTSSMDSFTYLSSRFSMS